MTNQNEAEATNNALELFPDEELVLVNPEQPLEPATPVITEAAELVTETAVEPEIKNESLVDNVSADIAVPENDLIPENDEENGVYLPQIKLTAIYQTVNHLELQIKQLKNLLSMYEPSVAKKINQESYVGQAASANIVEGVFDGEQMIGANGETYAVPANYASKSKLVEGDIMKLTITNNGATIFKQIKPIDRRRLTGVLSEDEHGNFWVLADNYKWRILTASVTYYKGEVGDEAVILVPNGDHGHWAAVENIVKKWQ